MRGGHGGRQCCGAQDLSGGEGTGRGGPRSHGRYLDNSTDRYCSRKRTGSGWKEVKESRCGWPYYNHDDVLNRNFQCEIQLVEDDRCAGGPL
jgi:hypothetical protein